MDQTCRQQAPFPAPQKKLNARQFKALRDIVYRACGIRLGDDKRELLAARLSRRLRALGIPVDQYLSMICNDAAELDRFVDAVTTNHTFFFRESRAFEVISRGCRRIWCAAASSGEEPYSLAAFCLDRGMAVSILATDISDDCLRKGRAGVYPLADSKHIPPQVLQKYFQRGCRQWEGSMRVKSALKRCVRFARFNLLCDPLPDTKFDIIFCRNVMIYFDKPTKETVVRKLSRALCDGGYFVIGGAESLSGLSHSLNYVSPSVYRKEGHGKGRLASACIVPRKF